MCREREGLAVSLFHCTPGRVPLTHHGEHGLLLHYLLYFYLFSLSAALSLCGCLLQSPPSLPPGPKQHGDTSGGTGPLMGQPRGSQVSEWVGDQEILFSRPAGFLLPGSLVLLSDVGPDAADPGGQPG